MTHTNPRPSDVSPDVRPPTVAVRAAALPTLPQRQAAARPFRALDLFCGAGGATRGLQLAGFHVTGVDIKAQPRYCGDYFEQMDAGDFLSRLIRNYPHDEYDFIWASPPCQAYTNAQRLRGNKHPDLIGPVREYLQDTYTPYVIENVPGAPLVNPIELCGAMFGLRTYRHRLFECSFPILSPPHPPHDAKVTKMGRRPIDGEFMHVVGNFSGAAEARAAMGIDWMSRDELAESIPPAFSEFIARAFLAQAARPFLQPKVE